MRHATTAFVIALGAVLAGCPAATTSPTTTAASSARPDVVGGAPAIKSFTHDPDTIAKDGVVTFKVDASSPLGKPLTYSWHASKGTIEVVNDTSARWKPLKADGTPDAGVATISVSVSDGGGGGNTPTALYNVAADGSASSMGGTAPAYGGGKAASGAAMAE